MPLAAEQRNTPMFAKEPSIPRRWPLYRGLRVIFCQCCDWLYFFFIAVIIFFSSLVWLAGDKLFFFSVSLLSGRELPALGSWVHSLAADSRCDAGWAISLPLSPPCSSLNWVGGVHWQRYEILGSSFERNEVGFVGRRNCIEVGRSVAFCVSGVSRVGVLA